MLAVAWPAGGVAASGPAIERVTCLERCAARLQIAEGGLVRLTGKGLDGATAVRFAGSPDPIDVSPEQVSDDTVDARVPAGALTGRPGAVLPDATVTAAETLEIVPEAQLLPPGTFDVNVSMRRPKAFFDSLHPAKLRYQFHAERSVDVEIQVYRRRTGAVMKSWVEPAAPPFTRNKREWEGGTDVGGLAPQGGYAFRIRPVGTDTWAAKAKFSYYRHIYPVRGSHWSRGSIGEFGAPRNGGRRHIGYDVVANCGTPLVAARGGTVQKRGYRSNLDGNFIVIDGRDTDYDYWYAHLRYPSWAKVGQRVYTGQQIGQVGKTGNARSVGCHLHFELWKGGYPNGYPVNPKPFLRDWDSWS